MTIVLDSHRRIRSGEVSPKLSKDGRPMALEVYSVEESGKGPPVQGELVANCETLDFRSRIYTVRGVQVMLDRDLASAYHVSTTVFNQAVKRNISRFPEGFRFQLTKEEHAVSISQIVTSKREAGRETRGGHHKLPYAFTEQGIAMLSGILRSDVAIAVSIHLMNTFVEMRRTLASMAPMQARLEAIERRQISDQSRNEERFDQIFARMSEGDLPLAQIFYQFHEDRLRHLPRPLHHRRPEGDLLVGCIPQRRRSPDLRSALRATLKSETLFRRIFRETGRGDDSRSAGIEPKGDGGEAFLCEGQGGEMSESKKMSLLDAAYEVLKKSGIPMSPSDMILPILESGVWATKGKTPEQTLGARLYVDIKKLGAKSRFVNLGNGRFALSGVNADEPPAQAPLPGFGAKSVTISGKTYSFTDCAEKVLKAQSSHKPMHYLDITRMALSKGWLKTSGQTPEATMYAQIIQEIQRLRKRGEVPRFVQCGKGLVALTVWDKAGVDFQVQQHHEDVRKKLKAKLMALKPEEFEELVSRLFCSIGFREVSRTRLSGDGGIDVRGTMVTGGVIRTELAIQVKRWKHNVQAPTVQQVRGSLGAHEQGCIVTTSDFSSGAREEASKMDKAPIALIDGKELINLLMENQIGVRRKEVPLFEVQENLLDDVDEDR